MVVSRLEKVCRVVVSDAVDVAWRRQCCRCWRRGRLAFDVFEDVVEGAGQAGNLREQRIEGSGHCGYRVKLSGKCRSGCGARSVETPVGNVQVVGDLLFARLRVLRTNDRGQQVHKALELTSHASSDDPAYSVRIQVEHVAYPA